MPEENPFMTSLKAISNKKQPVVIEPSDEVDAFGDLDVKKKVSTPVSKSISKPLKLGGLNDQGFLQGGNESTPLEPTPITPRGYVKPVDDSSKLIAGLNAYTNRKKPTQQELYNEDPTIVAQREGSIRKVEEDQEKAVVDKQISDYKKKHGDGFVSGMGMGITFLASKALKGVTPLMEAAAYGLEKTNPMVYGASMPDVNDKLNKLDDMSNLGLNKDYQGMGAVDKAIGGLVEFAPQILAAESTAGASYFIGGVGNAHKEIRKLKESGAKFENGADDLYTLGSGIVNYGLMTKLPINKLFSKMPASLRESVVGKVSMDALKQVANSGEKVTAEALVKPFQEASMKFSQKALQGGVNFIKDYAHTAKDLSLLTTADSALKIASNNLSGEENFKQTPEDLFNNIKNILTSDAPAFALLGGAIKTAQDPGALFRQSPVRNDVLNSIKEDMSPENLAQIKDDLVQHGQEQGWSPKEIENSVKTADVLHEAVKSIPKEFGDAKFNKAVDLITGRKELQDQLSEIKASKETVDESIRDVPTKEESLIQAKLDQSNDKMRELATDNKFRYNFDEDKGVYTKQLGEKGKPEEITKDRYELEQLEKDFKKPTDPVSKNDYDSFIDTGQVSDNILRVIAEKVKNNETLSERENAIFTDKTSEINNLISRDTEQLNIKKESEIPVVDTKNKSPESLNQEVIDAPKEGEGVSSDKIDTIQNEQANETVPIAEAIQPEVAKEATAPISEPDVKVDRAPLKEGEVSIKNADVSDKFKESIHKNIESDEVAKTLNNIERETGREFTEEEKEYQVTKLKEALDHGTNVVESAKEEFGDEYVSGLIDYLDNNQKSIPVENKSLITIALELDLERQIKNNPENILTLEKQLQLVRDISVKQQRGAAIAIGYGRLRQIARVGYDVNQITSKFFSSKENETRKGVEKSVQANADTINKEAQELEINNSVIDSTLEKAISDGVEKQINDIYEKLPSKRRESADKAIKALENIQKRLRSKAYDATIGIPVAIIDAGITTIKAAIKAGVSIADAIELGINKIKEKHGKSWSKEQEFRDDMLGGFKSEGLEVKEGKRIMTPEQKRKLYKAQLEKSIVELDQQIEAKKRNVITRDDKYKNDEEINLLRNKRTEKQGELSEIDPSYSERRKLQSDLNSAQKSLEEYERRIKEEDFEPNKKPSDREIDDKLKELREKRDAAKEEYQKKKREFDKSQEVEEYLADKKAVKIVDKLQDAKDRIKSRIEDVRQEIIDKKRQLKTQNKPIQADAELTRLQEEEKAIISLRDKYLPKDKAEFIDEKRRDSISNKLVSEIEAINKQINEGEKAVRSEKKDPYNDEKINKLKSEKKARLDFLEAIDPTPKEFIKKALIEKGFGREVKINGENREFVDWKKLAGEEGSVDKIKTNVETVLKEKGFNSSDILRMQHSFEQEYNNIRASVIEKGLNELNNRNKEKGLYDVKTTAKRLAELYNYGLFEKESNTYDYLMNNALGLNELSQASFFKAKELAKSLSNLFNSKDENGKIIDQFHLKQGERVINKQIEDLLSSVAWSQSSGAYKLVSIVKEYVGMAQRNALVSLPQAVENTTSGYIARLYNKIGFSIDNVDTKDLAKMRSKLAKMTYNDITFNGAIEYGDVNSPFITKTKTQEFINKASDSQLYHGLTSLALGKAYLESADSMHKVALTEKFFTYNLIKILRKKGYGKKEAVNFVSEQLTGQSFEEALKTSKQIIDKINSDAGKKMIPDTEQSIHRFANDIVKEALITGGKLNLKEVEASFNAAYTAAGFELGHEANNLTSKAVTLISSDIQNKLNKAIKEKNWAAATSYTTASIVTSNIMNPFVGGGTNWVFLSMQKAGIPTLSTLYWNIRARSAKIDLTTDKGMKNLEGVLEKQLVAKNANTRMFIGATVALSTYALFNSTDKDEEFFKWLKLNEWAKKYFTKLSPPAVQFVLAQRNKKVGEFFGQLLNIKVDAFDEGKKAVTVVKNLSSDKKDGKEKALGGIGDLAGSRLSTPIIPWRVVRDANNIYRGLQGLPPLKIDYQTSGFWNGYFKGGLIDAIGLRPDKTKGNKSGGSGRVYIK